jgi:hypothetical protein
MMKASREAGALWEGLPAKHRWRYVMRFTPTNTSEQVPVTTAATIEDALELAEKLEGDAQWFEIDTSELLSKFEAIGKDPATPQHIRNIVAEGKQAATCLENLTWGLFDQVNWLTQFLWDCAEAMKEDVA